MTETKKSDESLNTSINNDNITKNGVTGNDEGITEAAKTIEKNESNVMTNTNNDEINKCIEFSKKLQVGGQNILVVESGDHFLSGDSAPSCCIMGSPEHVAALKAKIDELKANLDERARAEVEAQTRSEQVAKQLDKLASELKQLGHGDADSEQTIHATVHTFGPVRKLEIISDEDEIIDYDRLWRLPRVRQYWHIDTLHREAEERTSSYTELFWDLIFVAVVQNLGHILVADISFSNIQRFIITFYPIYRIWLDVHNYLNVYSSKDISEKFLLLWEMCLVIVMGTHSSDVTSAIYLISYVVARLTLVMQYFLIATLIPLFRISIVKNAWGVFIPCILWIITIFVPPKDTIPLMWSAIAFEIFWTTSVPIYNRYGIKRQVRKLGSSQDFKRVDTASSYATLTPHKATITREAEHQWKWHDLFSLFKVAEYRPALNIEHWSERFGVFVIICLGEGLFGIIYSSVNPNLDGQLGKIYFDVDASRQYQHALRRHVITGVLFGLAHLPLNMSLIAFGSSLTALVQLRDFPGAESIPLPGEHSNGGGGNNNGEGHEVKRAVSADSTSEFPESLQWLFCVSLAISIYCMAIIGMLHRGLDKKDCLRIRKRYRISLRIIIATIIIFLPLSEINSLNLIVIVSILSLILVSVETYGKLRRNQPLFGKCDGDIVCNGERRYIRWRWGLDNLNQKGWTTGRILRRRRENNGEIVEEKIDDDNDIVKEEINIGMI